jgi:FAD/FMN-containing dehydrogenase
VTATSTRQSPSWIPALRDGLGGRVIGPQDPGYDQARAIFYGGFDHHHHHHHPTAIVRPTTAGQVAQVVGVARNHGLELAVRSGGHSLAGHSTTNGGIVLDLSDLHALDIDVEGRTAWAQGG